MNSSRINIDVKISNQGFKIALITIFHIFKKITKDLEDINMNQIKVMEMKTIMYVMKIILNGINGR